MAKKLKLLYWSAFVLIAVVTCLGCSTSEIESRCESESNGEFIQSISKITANIKGKPDPQRSDMNIAQYWLLPNGKISVLGIWVVENERLQVAFKNIDNIPGEYELSSFEVKGDTENSFYFSRINQGGFVPDSQKVFIDRSLIMPRVQIDQVDVDRCFVTGRFEVAVVYESWSRGWSKRDTLEMTGGQFEAILASVIEG